jgi:hypothetical protein
MKPILDFSLFPKSNRSAVWLVAVALALPYWGCGGSSSPSSPTAVATPEPCTQTTLLQQSGIITSSTLFSLPVTVATAGRLDLTVDWTFATNPVGLYLVQGSCTLDQFNARTCTYLLRVETSAKPKKASVSVTPGTYSMLVANFGPQQDSGVAQAVLSSATCPAVPAAPSAGLAELGAHRVERTGAFD